MSVKMIDHIVDEHSIDIDHEMIKRVQVTALLQSPMCLFDLYKRSDSNNQQMVTLLLTCL